MLEDKYLKDSLIRLKQKQILDLKNKNTYEVKIKELEKEYQKAKNFKNEELNKESNIDYKSEHEKRVAEILGN